MFESRLKGQPKVKLQRTFKSIYLEATFEIENTLHIENTNLKEF